MSIKDEHLSKIVAKNSAYGFGVAFVSKIGGFILTIMLARLLLPDLFGVYSLVLSIVMIAVTLTDVGADNTGARYMAKALAKGNKREARSYFRYLLKLKTILTIIAVIIIIIIAKPLSQTVFNKPAVFLPLIFSCLYLIVEPIRSFFTTPFSAKKDLKALPPLEAALQTSKIILSLIVIYVFSTSLKVSGVFVAFAISSLFSLSLISSTLIKKDRELIFGDVIKIDKKRVFNYMIFMGMTGITLILFGSVDTIMLGHFVDSIFLGYYRAAFVLISSFSALLPFSGVLLPIFTQIGGKRLKRGVQKSFKYLIIVAIPLTIGLMILSKYIIFLLYGKEYLPASVPLLFLSLLIIVTPLIALYSAIFQAKEKPMFLAKFAIISLLINIVLNYILIKTLLSISQQYAIIGAAIATLISNIFLLAVLMIKTNSYFKIRPSIKMILKSIFATAIMSAFLLVFMKFVNINLFSGALMVILGIIIYFFVIFLIKGLGKEDIDTFKLIIKKEEQ